MTISFKYSSYDSVKHLKGNDYVKWPRKLSEDPKARSSGRFCAFHGGYGPKTKECKILRTEVKTLVRMGYLKE